jgi:hypothetical protein
MIKGMLNTNIINVHCAQGEENEWPLLTNGDVLKVDLCFGKHVFY